jgi:polar amino acid transport system substrate-binding protein
MVDPHSRRLWLHGSLATAAGMVLTACGNVARLPVGASAALAPSGRLRASINLGNPILARRVPGTEQVAGVSVDLARSLAEQLGVPLDTLVVDSALKSVQAVTEGRADIGFFAIDPQRAGSIRFTAPYVLIEGAYLVRQDSPLTANEQVDRAGTRIMVGRGSAYDLYLSRALKAAQLMHTPTSPTVVEQFLAQNADVAAGVKQQMQADAARLGGLRLLPGRFMVIEQAMGLPAERGATASDALQGFVEWAKRSGFVAQALARHAIDGAVVAPTA